VLKVVTTLLLICCSAMAETTVLCLGDSITEGGKSFSVYRYPLYKKLKEAGIAVKFIGPKSTTHDGIKLHHAGYGGHNTLSLDKSFTKIYSKYKADIILLHSAHNYKKEDAVKSISQSLKSIIAKARKINPKVKVLLAQGITSGKLPKYSYIPVLNIKIKKLAKSLNVICVPQSEGFNWKTDTIKDKVHPNAKGAEKMAQKWFDAIRSLK
jgi:lysophospholipase L1-like esterase